MSNSFFYIFQLIQRHPRTTLGLGIIFLIGSLMIIKTIDFNEDINRVIPREQSIEATTATDIVQHMSFTDKISVIFEKKDHTTTEELVEVAQAFLDSVHIYDDYYHNIQGYLDEDVMGRSFQFIYNHLPLYLNPQDYQEIEDRLHLDNMRSQIANNHQTLMGVGGSMMKDIIIGDPLQLSFIALKKLQQFQGPSDFVFQDGYLFSKDESKLYLFINPKYAGTETKNNAVFVGHLRSIQERLNDEFNRIEIAYFGSAFIAVANAKQIKKDILTTVVISVSLLMFMLIVYYRNFLVPIIVMIPSLFGGLFGLLCLYFFRSEISAISLSVSAILIGITIDYALHFLTHSKESHNQRQLFRDVSRPLLMSSSTTAIAFLCLLFVRSEALVDLGIFASIAVVSTAAFTLIILPHVYPAKRITHTHLIDRVARYPFEKNKVLIGLTLLLLVISLFTYHRVAFDGDLTKINYIPEDQQDAERLLTPGDDVLKTLFIVSYGDQENEVLKREEIVQNQLERSPEVIQHRSLSSLVPSLAEQKNAIANWEQFWTDERKKETINRIERLSVAQGFIENTHEPFYRALGRSYSPITLDSIRDLDAHFYREFVHESPGQTILSTIVSVHPDRRDSFVENFEKSNQGQPVMVIDRQSLNEQYLGYLITDFNSLVGYSFMAVVLVLFIFYRRIELVIVASIPIALTSFITAGMMGLLNVPFNIFSTIVCTLIFGHGIDFTIFMTSALQKQYTTGKDEMPVYRTSIILAVLTTILAIGALIFAKHPALKSISAIALIGVSVAVLITFVLYPLLFKFLFFNRVKKGLSPATLGLLIESVLLFTYFAIASVIVSALIRCLSWIGRFPRAKKEGFSSRWVSGYMTSVLYLKPGVRKRIFNKERLKRVPQSILIANHSSFLDSLSMTMLHSKIVYLVNDWVYNSPVFGRAVRFLGFIPTSAGIDNQMGTLSARIGKQFSVVVFPEGTRSKSSEIHRFHKGAFLLAQKLDLPLTPIYLHGNADILPKGDFIVYDGLSDIHVGEPLFFTKDPSSRHYTEQAKSIGKNFRESFKQIRFHQEDENYFQKKLFLNYLYREANLSSEIKEDFKRHKKLYYKLFREIDEKSKIAHITSDFGQIDFLLVHQFPSRRVCTFNTVEEHRDISRASYINNRFHISYVNKSDELWDKQDVLLLSHIQEFDLQVPHHVRKIIILCSSVSKEFVDFDIKYQEKGYTVYQRNEKN